MPLSTRAHFTQYLTTLRLSVLAGLFLFLFTAPSLAQHTASGDHVRVRWLAPSELAAGEQTTLGFYFEVDPHWHVYWHNPGDSGAAPRFDVQSQGATVGEVLWPFPTRLPIEHLTNLGYEGNVAYLLPVTPQPKVSEIELNVDLEWLVCKVDCIPGFGQMSLRIPIGKQTRWAATDLALRDQFLARVPQSIESSPWQAQAAHWVGDEQVVLTLVEKSDVTSGALLEGETIDIYPVSGDFLTAGKPQRQVQNQPAGSVSMVFERVPGAEVPGATDFVVVHGEQAWRLNDVPLQPGVPLSRQDTYSQPLWWLLIGAFLGGVILNLMPCVFPVLSIKLFGLVQLDASRRAREGLVYAAGVLCTFALLGGALLTVRAGGAAIGWGFQLQSPTVILGLIILFWLMALSFSGVFEFGHRLVTLAGGHRGGAFVTGVLAVFVATPCTGPFMGAALGAAAVLPALSALLIFMGLGVGLAAPFVVLCLYPPLLNKMPRPGPWMDTLRQFLAFPLYATVIWLLWVLGRLAGDGGWLVGTSLLLVIVLAIWLASKVARGTLGRSVTVIGVLGALFFAYKQLELAVAQGNKSDVEITSQWHAFDPAHIEQARSRGQAVFIDYTAAWCITCQVNKKLVLDTPPVQDLFKQHNVYLVRADWTHRDDAITHSLASLGRNSVPVYAWYSAGSRQPHLLPQMLTEGSIRSLFVSGSNED